MKSTRSDRAPIEVPEVLKEYYKDRSVVEIGFGRGDFIPIWAKHAKQVIAYEHDWENFVGAQTDEALVGLENVILIQGIPSPEDVYNADVYHTSFGPPIKEFFDRMKSSGKTGTFATYVGIPPKYWENDPAPLQSYYCTFPSQNELEAWADEVIYFDSKENEGRPEFEEMENKSRLAVALKKL